MNNTRYKINKAKKKIYLILLLFWLAVIFVFTLQTGPNLISLSESTSEIIVTFKEKSGIIKYENSVFDNRIPQNIIHDANVNDLAIKMQDSIHVFLFMMLCVFSLVALKYIKVPLALNIIITFLLCLTIAVVNEIFQDLVFFRILEHKDIVNNIYGILIGYVVFILSEVFMKTRYNIKRRL